MLTYLFDASAVVELYVESNPKAKRPLEYILSQKLVFHQGTLLVPNVCVPEVFNALAKKRYKRHEISAGRYVECLKQFRKHIHWGRRFYPYDLNRYHIIAADLIIAVEQNVPSLDERDHLSTLDILVVAMACELAYLGRPEDAFLVTCDRRMKRVFEELKRTPPRQIVEWLTTVDLDYPIKRWSPPNCLLLQDVGRGELRAVDGQPKFNF